MVNLSKELSGVVLPSDKFGAHLDNNNKAMNQNLGALSKYHIYVILRICCNLLNVLAKFLLVILNLILKDNKGQVNATSHSDSPLFN